MHCAPTAFFIISFVSYNLNRHSYLFYWPSILSTFSCLCNFRNYEIENFSLEQSVSFVFLACPGVFHFVMYRVKALTRTKCSWNSLLDCTPKGYQAPAFGINTLQRVDWFGNRWLLNAVGKAYTFRTEVNTFDFFFCLLGKSWPL